MRGRRRHPGSPPTTLAAVAGTAVAALAAVVAVPPAAHAQTAPAAAVVLEPPRHRQGYFVAVGYHFGGNYNREDGESLGVWNGSMLGLRLGQMVTRRLGLALRIESGGSKKGTETASLFGLGMAGQWEIITNLAVHAGIGIGVLSISDSADPDADLRGAFGANYALGVSYDFFFTRRRLTGGWALTPVVQARFIPGDSVTALFVLGGLEISWWSGLPSNQLELTGPDAYKRE
jgi:hypothetical protein